MSVARVGRKRGSYTQAERVLSLYDDLQAGVTVRIGDKAQELGVDRRQIQRDLAIVRARLGPRVAQRPDGGWYVPRERQSAEDRRVALAQVLAVELGAKLSAFLWGASRMRAIQGRIDRLRDIRLGDAGGFQLPASFDARRFFGDAFGISQEGGPHDLTLEIDAEHARWFLERTVHPSQRIEQRTDGSLLVRMRASGSYEIVDWILSLGEHVELVEPQVLRAVVERRLRAALSRYGEGGDIFRSGADASSPSSRRKKRRTP